MTLPDDLTPSPQVKKQRVDGVTCAFIIVAEGRGDKVGSKIIGQNRDFSRLLPEVVCCAMTKGMGIINRIRSIPMPVQAAAAITSALKNRISSS